MPRLLTVFLSLLLLAGCALTKPPQDIDSAARLAFEQLRKGQDAALMARGTAELKAADPAVLAQIRAMLPKGEPTSSRAVLWRVTIATGGHQAVVEHEYVFAHGAAMVSTTLTRPSDDVPWQVHGVHVNPITQAAIEASAFSLTGKSAGQYAFLAAAIASPLLMIAAIVMVIRKRGLKRKWLWCLLSLAGLCSLTMNWATGEVTIDYISVQFIGAGVTKNLAALAPWLVTMTIPIGAVLAILRTRRTVAERPPEQGVPADAGAP